LTYTIYRVMAMRVIIFRDAAKDLDRLQSDVRDRIIKRLDELAGNPLVGGLLKGYSLTVIGRKIPLRRVKVGDYRVVYAYSIPEDTVYVLAIAHRRRVYKIVRKRLRKR